MSTMGFSQALESAKQGKIIFRSGWKFVGMLVFMISEATLPVASFLENPYIPQSFKDMIIRNRAKMPDEGGVVEMKVGASLCLKDSDGAIVNGWTPSQTDLLAEDWRILEV